MSPICIVTEFLNRVIRQLGFDSGINFKYSTFGSVPSTFAMDNVRCRSRDTVIQDCSHFDERREDCSSYEGAGVNCFGGGFTGS